MDVLAELPNTFEELNRVQCFNHTLQLSEKALLKPFYSTGSLETNDEIDDGMPALQAVDDEEEGDEGDDESEMDDEDQEEEEDPLSALNNDEREALIQNVEAVHTTLMKVCTYLIFHCFCAHITIGSQTLLCHCSFDHHCPSRMA